jgi:adenosylcobinamide-GDP ribazoletransferase
MAIRTLTIIPIPGKDPERKFLALPWFPLIGAGIGLLHVSGNYLFTLLPAKTPTLEAVFLCALNYIITGALHLDGLADTADAFGTPRTREKTLLILKDPHMGTFGVAALVFAILWRTLVYQLLIDQNGLFWIVYAMVFSRIIQGLLLNVLPYARDQSGKAFIFSGKPVMALIMGLELIGSIVLLSYFEFANRQTLLIAVSIGTICILPVCVSYLRRLKGITGDGIGASNELFELGFLTAALI